MTLKNKQTLLTRYPLCFMHGLKSIFNFRDYWHGVPRLLREKGFDTFELFAAWRGPNRLRLEQFANQIQQIAKKSSKVHLIAHSLGCLNALEIMNLHETKGKIASATLICPPFKGTPWAHLGLIGNKLGLNLFASTNETLTREAALKIVNRFEKPSDILVGSILANPLPYQPLNPKVTLQHKMLSFYLERHGLDPSNDGLVPLESQREAARFGPIFFEFKGDHEQVIGGGPVTSPGHSAFEMFLDHSIFLAEYDLKTAK